MPAYGAGGQNNFMIGRFRILLVSSSTICSWCARGFSGLDIGVEKKEGESVFVIVSLTFFIFEALSITGR